MDVVRGRLLSHTEVSTALTCWAQHDFAYVGRLAGSTLKPKDTADGLSTGRAWGAAVAAWHANSDTLLGHMAAVGAMQASLVEDQVRLGEQGVPIDRDHLVEQEQRLLALLDHYTATSTPIAGLHRLEDELVVPVPSRTGQRGSSRYKFLAKIDGYALDDYGNPWIVEFKLRNRLHDVALMEKSTQYRWYAWAHAWAHALGDTDRPPVGIIIDERLNEVPKPARVLANGKPSHAKEQMTTADNYMAVCIEADVEPHQDVIEALGARVWQHRHHIIFRPGELDEAGRQLVSAAKLIRDLDSGELDPIRNAKTTTCNFCRFKAICANPEDDLHVDSLFERTVPKRLRPPLEVAS